MPGFLATSWRRLQASPLGYRLARGAFWTLLGTLLARGFALAGTIVVARILGKEVFGALGMVQSTVGMFGTVAGFGLGVMATKHIAEFRKTNPQRAGRIIYLSECMCWVAGGVGAIGMFFAAPWLALHSLANPGLAGILRISALYLLFTSVNGGQLGILSGFEAFREAAKVNLWVGVLNFTFSIAGCWWGGLGGAVWGLAISQAFVCVISFWIIKRHARQAKVPMLATGWQSELSLLWGFNLPLVLTNMLGIPVAWLCQSLLARQAKGYEHLADYFSALQLRNIPLAMIGVVVAAVLPVYTNSRAEQGSQTQRKVLRLMQFVILATIFPILLIMATFAGPILFAYGKDFQTGAFVLRLLLLSVAFEAMATVNLQIMVGSGLVWQVFHIYIAGSIVFIILSYTLVPTMQGPGLGCAWVGIQFVRWVVSLLYIKRLNPTSMR